MSDSGKGSEDSELSELGDTSPTAQNKKSKKKTQKITPVDDFSLVAESIEKCKSYDVTKIDGDGGSTASTTSDTGFFGGYRRLFSFCDKIDYQLIAIGLLCALLQAIIPPIAWLVMGNFFTLSIVREEVIKTNRTVNFAVEVGNETTLQALEREFEKTAVPTYMLMLGLSVFMFFVAFIQRLFWEMSAIRQVFRVKKAYIRKLLHMDVAWLESRQSGQVATMLHEHTEGIYMGIADHVPMVLFIIVYMISNVIVCLYIQWDVTLLMCSAIPILIISRILFGKWFAKSMEEENGLHNKLSNLVTETFSCIRTVISFAAQKQTINKFDRLSTKHCELTEARMRSEIVYDSLSVVLITELIFTVAFCYGIWRVADRSPGDLNALAINMLYLCVNSISIGIHMNGASKAREKAKQIGEILAESPKIEVDRCSKAVANPDSPKRCESFVGIKAQLKGKGAIRVRNVTFSYPSRPDISVLKNLTFDVTAGERLAVVGSSGSGKSTLTALLLRFYDPDSGSISLDDADLRAVCPDELRGRCSLVSQEPVLFDGTISDNIRYGRLDATQQEINEAARKVGAWEFISALPDGMQTRVGDRGLQLSGGQKQRVAIARAVIRKPTVLIFDEATSALDNKHEEEVCQAIELASEGLTTITIAHRLSTVKNCDRILVLENGQIAEMGSPKELLAKENGVFRRMISDQSMEDVPGSRVRNTASFSSTEIVDPEARRTWLRNSLGASKRSTGKSYAVLNESSEKLALPVMSKKRGYKSSVAGTEPTTKVFEQEIEEKATKSKTTNWKAARDLIRGFRRGYFLLVVSFPLTIIRSAFFLLVCFEVSSILELAIVPEEERAQGIFFVGAVFAGLIIIKTIFEALGRLSVALYGQGFCSYMRSEMFRKMLRHGTAYFDEEQNSPGRLVHKVINESAMLNKILAEKLEMIIPALVCPIVAMAVALVINWKMALLCSFQFPAYVAVRILQLKEGTKRQRQMVEEEKKATALATVVLSNMSTIKAYNLQEHFYSTFSGVLQHLAKALRRQSVVSAFVFAANFSTAYILIAITLHFGKEMMLKSEISVFDFSRVVLLTQFGSNFLAQLIASVSDFSKAFVAAEDVMKILKEPALEMDNLSEEGCRPIVEGEVTLNKVHFRYPSRPLVPVLKNLSLKVPVGKSIALVGASGSGKSSILALLQRMYSPTQGEVLIDKYDVRTMNPAYLRRVVVSVGQEPTLFSFTIRENIAYGLNSHEATLDNIIEAAKIANIHDFITSLPQGYDTEVGEFGAQLSGGQKQRIAIARALIRRPKVLLLDEATAALDSSGEKAVKAAFKQACKTGVTSIHVAHRLSSIRHVDRIYVIGDGEICEEGSHEELMQLKKLYYEMTLSA